MIDQMIASALGALESAKAKVRPTGQEGFNSFVKQAQGRRGEFLSEDELLKHAALMGAEDPFPIGVQFTNQQSYGKPLNRSEREKINMQAVMDAAIAKKEQGIAQYEQGIMKPGPSTAINRVTGIDQERKALYDAAMQAKNQNQVSAMNAAYDRNGMNSQNRGMDLMMRRDPRAAAALIASQLNAKERGLDRESQAMTADREMAMRAEEAAAQREFQGGLARDQMGLTREGFTRADTREENRAKLENERIAKQMEVENAREGRLTDLEKMKIAATTGASDKEIASRERIANAGRETPQQIALKGRLDGAAVALKEKLIDVDQYNAMVSAALAESGAPGAAPTATPAGPKLIKNEVNPTLRATWDAALFDENKNKRAINDFAQAVPFADIENNKDAFQKYLSVHFPNKSIKDLFSAGFWKSGENFVDSDKAATLNRILKLYNEEPTNTTFLRRWGYQVPGLYDYLHGMPE